MRVRWWTLGSAAAVVLTIGVASAAVPPVPIPADPRAAEAVDDYIGAPAPPRPLQVPKVPRHPFMAPNDSSNIHDDGYMTDTARNPGPLGREPEVRSTFQGAECASVTFDAAGRIITICVGVEGPRIMLLHPETLETLAVLPLPARAGVSPDLFSDFSGGGYFYLDHKYRAVVPTTTRQILVIAETETPGFELVRAYDPSPAIPPDDAIVSVLPDWDGRIWFATREGRVGTVDRRSGEVAVRRLDGERVNNSFAVDETGGVYIVSDHALYRFEADSGGPVKITWREPYDRGERLKPGQANFGSGTTPTLIGKRYVAITDNADPRMHVLVFERAEAFSGDRLVCSEPVFGARKGATDQSLIAAGRSLVAENNYGYEGPLSVNDGSSTQPGLVRVDLDSDGDGCSTVWESNERSPSAVPKASLVTGLVYTHTKPAGDPNDPWYLTAIDFRSGKTVFKQLAGTGLGYNNNWSPITLGADGAAYVGALGGLIRVADTK